MTYLPQKFEIVTGDLMLQITYFYDEVSLDADNIVKPIQDALIDLVYVDDGQITDVLVRKRKLLGSFSNLKMTPILAEGFAKGQQFLHIVLGNSPIEDLL